MDHGLELAAVEPGEQVFGGNEVGDLALGEIAPLAVRSEKIVDSDIGPAGLVEPRDHIRTDKSGRTGDQQHRRRTPPAGWPPTRGLLCPRPPRRATPRPAKGKRRERQHANSTDAGGRGTRMSNQTLLYKI